MLQGLMLLSGLIAAIFWNLLTWYYGIPSSSSHALLGGFVGAAIAHAGFASVFYSEVIKIIAFIVLAPIIGFIIAFIIAIAVAHICRNISNRKSRVVFKFF